VLTTAKRTRHNYASIDVAAESITPLYDNLLVRRIYDAPKGSIIDPGVHQTLDGRWLKNSDEGPRKGVIVAMGQGDKFLKERMHATISGTPSFYHEESRVTMDVQVGDTIIYPRFESSHVKIGGEMYTFVREADVMAVIEP